MSKKTNTKNKVEQRLAENTFTKHISFLPIVLMLAVVPLILRWHIIPLDEAVSRFWTGETEMDLFCMGKSIMIMILSVVMFASLFFAVDRHNIKNDSFTKLIFGTLGIFLAVSMLSTVTSDYRNVALWGAPERHEGLIMYICYMIMFIYTYFMLKDAVDFKYIKYALIFLSGVMLVVGVSQILNKDIVATDFISKLVIPKQYQDMLNSEPTYGIVYLTLMNPNYVGSYAALIIPFFAVIALSNYENKVMRAVIGAIVIATTVILVKANSQAGLVGVAIAVAAIFIIYFKRIFKNKKLLIGAIVVAIAATGMANVVSKGLLLDNTLDILKEAKGLVSKDSSYVHDPTYGLPIYDVQAKGNKVRLETVAGQLNMEFKDGLNIRFSDGEGNPVGNVYDKENRNYQLSAPYEKLEVLESSESNGAYSQIALNYDNFTYFLLEWVNGDGVYLIDSQANRYELEVAPHIGFEGNEKVGSMRGYIWSRTLPLIAKKPLLGYGPDNFLMTFPHNDIVAKTYAYDTPFMIVDKPHNIYLLYAMNSGIFAMLSMMVLWGAYIVDSLKLYALKKEYSEGDYYGVACLVAIIGYLGAGFFNDSVPVISPVFWVILGAGCAINYINKKARLKA
ncbi:MAG: O-antigen ligase family protein [Proteocatella sp.]